MSEIITENGFKLFDFFLCASFLTKCVLMNIPVFQNCIEFMIITGAQCLVYFLAVLFLLVGMFLMAYKYPEHKELFMERKNFLWGLFRISYLVFVELPSVIVFSTNSCDRIINLGLLCMGTGLIVACIPVFVWFVGYCVISWFQLFVIEDPANNIISSELEGNNEIYQTVDKLEEGN